MLGSRALRGVGCWRRSAWRGRGLSSETASVPGRATVEGTLARASGTSTPYTVLGNSGLHVSRVAFGGDEIGVFPDSRALGMRRAVVGRGVNLIEINLDAVIARFDETSALYEPEPSNRTWESEALGRIVEEDKVGREGIVVVGVASLGSANVHGSAYGPSELGSRVSHALELLGVELDVLVGEIPPQVTEFGASDVDATVKALSACVREENVASWFGVGCSRFSTTSKREAQPIHRILDVVKKKDEGEKLACVRYAWSLLEPWAILPSAEDENGKEWSVAELFRDANVAQLIKNPFDCVSNGRPFRTVDCVEENLEKSELEALAASLNDSLNFAIHLEQMFESEVLTAIQEEVGEKVNLPSDKVTWGRVIGYNFERLDSLAEWDFLWWTRIDPALTHVLRVAADTKVAKEWARAYQAVMLSIRDGMTQYLQWRHRPRARRLAHLMDQALPPLSNQAPLHAKVASTLLSSPVDVILTELPEVFGEVEVEGERANRGEVGVKEEPSLDWDDVKSALQSSLHPDTIVSTIYGDEAPKK